MSCSGSTSCGMENPRSFDAIGAIPIKFGGPGSYSRRVIKCERTFYTMLVDWMQTLRFNSDIFGPPGMNDLRWIGHVGAYVCKPGCHGQGRAIDINRIQWNGMAVDMHGGDHASNDRTVRRRYLAVDASCRRYFRYTLDGWYNADHTNHIHVDDHSQPVFSKDSVSDVGFIQAVCNNFDGAGLPADGQWGPKTQDAWHSLNAAWGYNGCDPFSNRVTTAEWCDFVMAHGFADVSASAAIVRSPLC